ncbi:MAG: hypothetical protein Q8P41_29320 [Pseudomonadota bacterium]|nr:hypothetical protein [Pseudomonadota bacterium]
MKRIPLYFSLAALAACNPKGLNSEAEAELAYVGLDQAVTRGLALGLQGFNAASSANIDPQEEEGAVSGTMIITGQADQGASVNKGLRLFMELEDYSDTLGEDDAEDAPDVLYDTDSAALPALTLSLRDIPDGTLEGTLVGTFAMAGILAGGVHLDLALSGTIEDDGSGGTVRTPGALHVTGTASSDYGDFPVDVTR